MSESKRPPRPRYQQPPRQRKKFAWWTIWVIFLCACVLAGAYVFAEDQLDNYNKFHAMRTAISADTFYGPVFVDGVALSGMTIHEAREALSGAREEKASAFSLTLETGSIRYTLSAGEVPMSWNTEDLLERAYTIGRVGSLEERYHQIKTLDTPIYLESAFTYDKSAVRDFVDRVAGELYIPGSDAAVVAFDVPNRTFTFADETIGRQVDADALYEAAIEQLADGEYTLPVQIPLAPIEPAITRAQLEKNYTRISTFTTKTTKDDNRNENIRLAADAINGAMIPSGGTLSFNGATGERTKEKGYKEAGAIENGRTIKETGGGVCQVSSTLFNALARADAEIVDRKPHAWPSDYVPRGEDATVDWPRLDLVMRNPGNTPMFITAWYEDQHVTVEVYGYSLGENIRVELQSETTYQKEPSEVVYTYNPNLAVGTTTQIKKPHTGYSVQTYKVRYEGDTEIQKEPFYKSEYRVINEEYEYNDGKPPAGN